MKKFFKKAAAFLMVAVVLAGVNSSVASAETSKVIVHTQDGQAWGSMNVYNWGDDGETAGAWPGTAMTAEADGWYTYTFDTAVPLNLVFSAEGGTPQSSNIEGVAPDAKEIWVVVGGAGEANDLGASTNTATLFTEPQEGWPVAAAVEAAADTSAEDTTVATATDTAATELPKTGVDSSYAYVLLALACVSGAMVFALKNRRVSEN